MQTPEILLMGAGIVLFITLIFLLIRGKLQGKASFLLFLVVIIMIGYPTIQKITVDGDMVSIVTYSNAIARDPGDTVAAKQLVALLDKQGVVSTLQNNPAKKALAARALNVAASAAVIRDDLPAAKQYLAKATLLTPNSDDAKIVRQHLTTVQGGAPPEEKAAAKSVLEKRFLTK